MVHTKFCKNWDSQTNLAFPPRVYPVFHVSLLKPYLGKETETINEIPHISTEGIPLTARSSHRSALVTPRDDEVADVVIILFQHFELVTPFNVFLLQIISEPLTKWLQDYRLGLLVFVSYLNSSRYIIIGYHIANKLFSTGLFPPLAELFMLFSY